MPSSERPRPARIVFVTWGSLGDLHPYLGLAVEMKRRGHDAVVATLPALREHVERAGLEFRPIRPDVSPDDPTARELVRRVLDARGGPGYLFKKIFKPYTRATYEDTLSAVDGTQPADLVVSHQVPLTTPIVAQQTGMKWISGVLLPMAFLSAYDPPTPPQAPVLRRVATWHPSLARGMNRLAGLVTQSWVEPIYQLRRELGLHKGGNPVFEGQHSPTLVLALFSRVLARMQPDYPPHTLITGFPFYDGAHDATEDRELLGFLDGGDPPIVFTLGSSAVWVAGDFYKTSLAAAQKLGRRALLLVGESAAALRPGLPPAIGVFDYAPHSLVMPRASAVVHQGGVGTTGQALRSGRPMLVMPYGQDQPDNARRVVELGVARTISRTRYTVDRAAHELSALLSNPDYARRAAEVGEQVRAERGIETACDAIEQVLQSSVVRRRTPARPQPPETED
jgi:rhamnosyltransferase subunit B